MPISTRAAEEERYGDPDHWEHVRESLFVKAVIAAGYEPIRPEAQGSHLIHEVIIKHLEKSDLVLCDLSGHNPNVFFELGVRTSLNKPIALVKDEFTDIPFDTGGINTHTYKSTLNGWHMDAEQADLKTHIEHCATSCAGENPLWRKFGLTLRAQEPTTDESPMEAKLDLLLSRIPDLEAQVAHYRDQNDRLAHEVNRFHVQTDSGNRLFDLTNPLQREPASADDMRARVAAQEINALAKGSPWARRQRMTIKAEASRNPRFVDVTVMHSTLGVTPEAVHEIERVAASEGVGIRWFRIEGSKRERFDPLMRTTDKSPSGTDSLESP